jgi:hypothetical protein
MADTPLTNGKHDVWTHRIAVSGLIVFMIADIAATAYLALDGRQIPDALPAIAFSCVTVLASMIQSIMKGNQQ